MIHPTAIIDKNAILGENIEIGPYSVIESDVQLGRAVKIAPYVHLKGNTYIGDNTFIGSGSVIGEAPQILGKRKALGKVYIGKNNTIREYTTINCSSSLEKATVMGDDNYLMAFSHLAHDCKLANGIVICNGSLIAGHVEIHDKAFISGNVAVHQFTRIGRLSMVGGLSRVNQDIPPFMMVVGDSRVWGINLVGIKRAGFKHPDLAIIKDSYNYLYRKKLPLKSALAKIREIKSPLSEEIALFILSSQRGICGPKKSTLWEKLFLDYPYFLRTRIPFPNRY